MWVSPFMESQYDAVIGMWVLGRGSHWRCALENYTLSSAVATPYVSQFPLSELTELCPAPHMVFCINSGQNSDSRLWIEGSEIVSETTLFAL